MIKSKKACFVCGKFPTFWVIMLVIAAVWFAKEIGWISLNVPWFPVILGIVAIGAIVSRVGKNKK